MTAQDHMFVVLWGGVHIWTHDKSREERRADAERIRKRKEAAQAKAAGFGTLHEADVAALVEARPPVVRGKLIKTYSGGGDDFPWFGEVFQCEPTAHTPCTHSTPTPSGHSSHRRSLLYVCYSLIWQMGA
jgi:hypothetical protein